MFIDAGAKNAAASHSPKVTDAMSLTIAIADGILGQHHQVVATLFWVEGRNRTIDDIHLIADDRLTPVPPQLQQLDSAVHHPVVGEGQAGIQALPSPPSGALEHHPAGCSRCGCEGEQMP